MSQAKSNAIPDDNNTTALVCTWHARILKGDMTYERSGYVNLNNG